MRSPREPERRGGTVTVHVPEFAGRAPRADRARDPLRLPARRRHPPRAALLQHRRRAAVRRRADRRDRRDRRSRHDGAILGVVGAVTELHGDRPGGSARAGRDTARGGSITSRCARSLEIAQDATLRPIADVAADAGIEPDELEQYGRHKAKVDLSILDRLAGRPDGKIVNVTAITPTPAGEGKTTTSVALTQGLGAIGRTRRARAARGVARPGLRREGRSGGRRLRAGRADGGPEPPLHGRPARDHGREQPPLGADRRAPPARQRARARPALDHVAAVHGHERPLPPRRRHRPRRADERPPAADRASTSRRRAR